MPRLKLRAAILVHGLLAAAITGCNTPDSQTLQLHEAALADDCASVRTLASSDPRCVNKCDGNGESALCIAAENGAAESAKALLNLGANVHQQDHDGLTPLHWAASRGNVSVATLLVARHADVNARSRASQTPLHLAALGYPKTVLFLLRSGADVNASDDKKMTALEYAVKQKREDIVRILLAHGANPNTRDLDSWSPLLYAANYGYVEIAQVLVEHGADPNLRAMDGRSPLGEAKKEWHLDLVAYLQGKGGHE